ncbi:MAG: hypothetical protein JWO36_2914 [Myxococcales bacterium]|nr:hypothetical protein [Myxococcales bacterium]
MKVNAAMSSMAIWKDRAYWVTARNSGVHEASLSTGKIKALVPKPKGNEWGIAIAAGADGAYWLQLSGELGRIMHDGKEVASHPGWLQIVVDDRTVYAVGEYEINAIDKRTHAMTRSRWGAIGS